MVTPESVANNRALSIAGCMYGFNALLLTIRATGHLMEQSKTIGIIQIAFFRMLKDVITVFLQFLAILAAFSIALTKFYISEKSLHGKEMGEKGIHT